MHISAMLRMEWNGLLKIILTLMRGKDY